MLANRAAKGHEISAFAEVEQSIRHATEARLIGGRGIRAPKRIRERGTGGEAIAGDSGHAVTFGEFHDPSGWLIEERGIETARSKALAAKGPKAWHGISVGRGDR